MSTQDNDGRDPHGEPYEQGTDTCNYVDLPLASLFAG